MSKDNDNFNKNKYKLNNVKIALDRIIKAINNREKIIIYGHYDLDCITGVSLLILVLRYLNADVEYYIPRDINDNCEINKNVLDNYIKILGSTLIITVGCGINSCNEVEYCKQLGIDTIITDYRKPLNKIPNTCVINYNENNDVYKDNFTAVGIAFKLAKRIAKYYKMNCIDKYMDLVMLGIISADANIECENRDYILNGIKRLKHTNNYGLKALIKINNINKIDLKAISKLVNATMPTINPIGKMDNAKIIVELFTTSDSYRAEQIAKYLKKQVENNEKFLNVENSICKFKNYDEYLQFF